MMVMPTTTIQDRLRFLMQLTGLDGTGLSRKAGLSPNFVGRILADKSGRSGVSGRAAAGLSWATGASQGWIISGTGKHDNSDVAPDPPPNPEQQVLEDHPDWVRVALGAIEKERGRIDFAVMGVGEETYTGETPDLTVYSVLARAEKIAKATVSNPDERERLDSKLRAFVKAHAPKRKPAPLHESGKHKTPPRGK